MIASLNGKYICADKAGSNPLIANRDALKAWESFSFEIVSTVDYVVNNTISVVNTTIAYASTDNSTVTVEIPSGTQPGDLMVMVTGTSGGSAETPTGDWTTIKKINKDSGDLTLYAYYKAYKAGDPDSYTYDKANKKFAAIRMHYKIN